MKPAFVKTINGHEMEFVRLMYPVRYNVHVRILNANPITFDVEKNDDGEWNILEAVSLPFPISDVAVDIKSTIASNEMTTA